MKSPEPTISVSDCLTWVDSNLKSSRFLLITMFAVDLGFSATSIEPSTVERLVGPDRPSDDVSSNILFLCVGLETPSERRCEDRPATLEESLSDIWVIVPEFGVLRGPRVKKGLRNFVIKNLRNAFRTEALIKLIELVTI
ncbi:unnamed protein product [Adineta ricciae]|uniref:Uncharacterized protein n=1 Tax=Adineta ricciae TaxID=249248 RepID=A0A816BMD5_ADIRI|nr:unnamed protein product [Adineta ricciae]